MSQMILMENAWITFFSTEKDSNYSFLVKKKKKLKLLSFSDGKGSNSLFFFLQKKLNLIFCSDEKGSNYYCSDKKKDLWFLFIYLFIYLFIALLRPLDVLLYIKCIS